jgi:hypothetical protein
MSTKIKNFIISIVTISVLNLSFSQTLKTFSGPFADGKANYTYYSDEYGNEILQGKFSYSGVVKAEKATATCTITGTFKDGKRSGRWEFKTGGQGSYTKNILGTYAKYIMNSSIDVIATYSNGVLDGEFTLTKIQNDYIPDLGQNGHINSDVRCKFNFKDGVLDGKFQLIDKDDEEPENMSGTVKNGCFDGLISDDGKELIFKEGLIIKNQNWNKEDQDELKITVANFMPFAGSSEEIQKENNFKLIKQCDSYPSTLIDNYLNIFYANTDFLHSDIGGDKGYSSSGCYYIIEDLSSLPDFKTSEHSQRLNELSNNKDIFGFVTYYSKIEDRLKEFKPSSLMEVQQQYKEMLTKIPEAIAHQNKLFAQEKDLLNEVQDFTSQVNSNTLKLIGNVQSDYRVNIDRKKIIFKYENLQFNLPGRYLLTTISNNTNNALTEIERIYFTNPLDKLEYKILNASQENRLEEIQKSFTELKTTIVQLISDEENLIRLLSTLKEESKKGSSERSLAEVLIQRFDDNVYQYQQEKINKEQYITQLKELNLFYTSAQSSLQLKETIASTKLNVEMELKNAKNLLETAILNYSLKNINQIELDFNAFWTQIASKSLKDLDNNTKDIQNQLDEISEQKNQLSKLKESLTGYELSKTQFLTIEFTDKNLSKTIRSLIDTKVQFIQEKYLQNKTLIISKENYLTVLSDFHSELTNQLNLMSNLQKLQPKELSKEDVKNLKKVKDNQEELIKMLLSF